jgi:hypothetical protein
MRRNQAIELLRILGAFGIVWFHSGAPGHEIAYSGLSLFIIITLYFETGPNWDRHRSIKSRALRLLWPWAFWFAVYAAGNVALGKDPVPLDNGLIAGILDGSHPHLWYLPFMFAVLVLIDVVKPIISQKTLFRGAAALFFFVFVTASVWRPTSLLAGPPYEQWAQATPALLLGILFGAARSDKAGHGVILAAMLMLGYATALGHFGLPHTIAAGLMLAALAYRGKAHMPLIAEAAGVTFGVYLIHPIFLHLFNSMRDDWEIGYPMAAIGASFMIVLAYRAARNVAGHQWHLTLPSR